MSTMKTFSGQNLEIFFHRNTKKSGGFKNTFSSKVKFWQIIIVEGIKEAVASTSDLIILKNVSADRQIVLAVLYLFF